MIVNLLRHAIAEERRAGLEDRDRELTEEGRIRVKAVLKLAAAAGAAPDTILSSPLTRAVQTAEIAEKVLRSCATVAETPALSPDAAPDESWRELRRLDHGGEVLAVGHEPQLSHLAAHLLGTPKLKIDFKKGAIMRIRFDRVTASPHGVLEWMIVPRMRPR